MRANQQTLRIAVPAPLRCALEYLPPACMDLAQCPPGVRVRVPFGSKTRIGVVLGIERKSTLEPTRLRRVLEVLDERALLSSELLAFLNWASEYFHHPIGEVVVGTLPAALRQGRHASPVKPNRWRLTASGLASDPGDFTRATRLDQLFSVFQANVSGMRASELDLVGGHDWRRPLRRLLELGLIEPAAEECKQPDDPMIGPLVLNPAQSEAVDAVAAGGERFNTFLLDGVTGSGKTLVYTVLIERVIAAGKQALVLIPEIGLTPQIAESLKRRLNAPVAILHSALGDAERLRAWSAAQRGEAAVIIGTRSAVFVPLTRPGLLIVDEEHDLSFKQQDGFRYSARDLAVVRARQLDIPLVLWICNTFSGKSQQCRAGALPAFAFAASRWACPRANPESRRPAGATIRRWPLERVVTGRRRNHRPRPAGIVVPEPARLCAGPDVSCLRLACRLSTLRCTHDLSSHRWLRALPSLW